MDRVTIERISKALANDTRLLIFEDIAGSKEMNCSAIASQRGVTPATVSHHLKVLLDAGLIECRRHGQFVRNRVLQEIVTNYANALSRLSRTKRR
jgi:ArsR family transcriptional regulator